MTKRPKRAEMRREQTWDLEGLFATPAEWEAELNRADALLPEMAAFQGRLGSSAGDLLACLRLRDQINKLTGRVSFYASNSKNADQTNPDLQNRYDRAVAQYARAASALSFIVPELLSLPEGTIERFLAEEPALAPYRLMLLDVLAEKEHMLGAEAEAVIAQMTELTAAPFAIFQATANADMVYEPVVDEKGQLVPMSLAALSRLLQSPDRGVRQAAYESAVKAFDGHKRAIAAAFTTAQKRDVILARLRKYPNSLAAALGPLHLPEELFYTLLKVSEEAGAPHFRRYMEFRRKELGLEQLMPWDTAVPLDADFNAEISFQDAWSMIKEALAPLGAEYGAVLEQAMQERWVDWADNDGKESGAYQSDCFGYHPVILMTWTNKISDAFTLAHELGHAVHTVFATRNQPYISSEYSLFLAEMASTTNELLLANHLIRTATSREMKRYVLTRAISAFISNFFGASMMASLQLQVHQMVEQDEPLTYESVTAANIEALKRWYGDTVPVTENGLGANWLRPPHNYFNYYSYQYATGISAAAAFSDAILTEGAPAVERYLRFLSAGSSKHDIDILKEAGVDMTSPAPLERAVKVFAALVDELERA